MAAEFDVLIIGAGPGGMVLNRVLRPGLKVGVLRPEDHALVYCAMPYVIEGLLPLDRAFKGDEMVTGTGAELIRDTATAVDFDARTVTTAKGAVLRYKKLVIATGADPVIPPVPGHDLAGVTAFKTETDLRRVLAARDDGLTDAVVVGAGAIGVELAQALHEAKVRTHLCDMLPSILPALVGPELVAEPQKALADAGIQLHLGEKVAALEGSAGHVERVRFESGKVVELGPKSLVAFAIGFRAATALFKGTALKIGATGIVVDPAMRTNIPDVYAVGDCVEFASAVTGDVVLGKLATNAIPMAKVAGRHINGDATAAYPGFVNGSATKVMDFYIGSTGLTEAAARARGMDTIVGVAKLTTRFPILPGAKPVVLKLIAERSTLRVLGGEVLSQGAPATDKVDLVSMAVQFNISVPQLSMFSYSSQPFQTFFPSNNLIVTAAEDILMQLHKQQQK